MTMLAATSVRPTTERQPFVRAPIAKAMKKAAGRHGPHRTRCPKTRALNAAPTAMVAAAAIGARRRQATGTVIASTPMQAAIPPWG